MAVEEPWDEHDEKLNAYAEAIREKARLRDQTSYKGPVWHRLQAEIDQLTEEMLDYQAKVPELRAQERRERRGCRLGCTGLLLTVGIIAACTLGWLSWWWAGLALVGLVLVARGFALVAR